MRQIAFDNYETTDDHGMVIVGTAVDQQGNPFFKVKNSWTYVLLRRLLLLLASVRGVQNPVRYGKQERHSGRRSAPNSEFNPKHKIQTEPVDHRLCFYYRKALLRRYPYRYDQRPEAPDTSSLLLRIQAKSDACNDPSESSVVFPDRANAPSIHRKSL